jgi:hypothetical protein
MRQCVGRRGDDGVDDLTLGARIVSSQHGTTVDAGSKSYPVVGHGKGTTAALAEGGLGAALALGAARPTRSQLCTF